MIKSSKNSIIIQGITFKDGEKVEAIFGKIANSIRVPNKMGNVFRLGNQKGNKTLPFKDAEDKKQESYHC